MSGARYETGTSSRGAFVKRREFIALFGSSVAIETFGLPLVAKAQPANRVARIAYLGASSPSILDPRQIDGFKQGLRENGLIEGRNIVVEYLWAEGDEDRLKRLAGELAQRNLDVIVTAGPQAVHALMSTGTTVPIVFAIVGDAIGNGVVTSLSRPTGNVTGLSMSNTDLESKRIEILKEASPAITKIMVLHDPSSGPAGLPEAAIAARALSVELDVVEANHPDQFNGAFVDATRRGANAIATFASPFFNFHRKQLIELATQNRLPSIWEAVAYVKDGGLLSYGPSFSDMYRRSAGYVAKILNGAKPADLPVEQPIRFELAVNVKTAKAFGLTVPPTLLARSDEVIE
jgi:putative tryptophan/tyrosine transport system substrate-binding protein